MSNKNYIGITKQGELVFQELNNDGTIRGFNTLYPTILVDGEDVLTPSSWTHKVKLVGHRALIKTGHKAFPTSEMPKEYEGLNTCETTTCEECGAQHNSDESYNPTWTIVGECTAVCLECRTPEQVLTLVRDATDLFKSKVADGVDLSKFEEIETLFCDSSGMGSEWERALTKKQAETKVLDLLKKHGEMYSAVTDMGKFQVYVTLYKKSA